MSVCISHDTADRYLEILAHRGVQLEPVSSSLLNECGSNAEEVGFAVRDLEGLGADWPDVLVTDDKKRRSNRCSTTHKWSGRVPENSIYAL